MGRAVWVYLAVVFALVVPSATGWAVERQLSGVRLGEGALSLLDRREFGQPEFIGPLGTLTITADQPPATAAPGAALGAGARSGPAGPTAVTGTRAAAGAGMRGGPMGGTGARGGPMAGAGMRGGSMGGTGARGGPMAGAGMRGGPMGGTGARGGPMAGAGMRGGPMGGAMGAGGTRQAPAVTAPTQPRAGAPARGMYWLYRRPGGATLVLSLNPQGEVVAIGLNGNAPSPGGSTSRGIGLGSGYMEVISQYGYPDQAVSSGTVLEMTYVDHGVRFTLDSMRVREIVIGAHIAAEAGVAAEMPEVRPTPPAGMSIEELRGYL